MTSFVFNGCLTYADIHDLAVGRQVSLYQVAQTNIILKTLIDQWQLKTSRIQRFFHSFMVRKI